MPDLKDLDLAIDSRLNPDMMGIACLKMQTETDGPDAESGFIIRRKYYEYTDFPLSWRGTAAGDYRNAGHLLPERRFIEDSPFGIPEAAAALTVVILQVWKRNSLLSILTGTLLYMFLVQIVF